MFKHTLVKVFVNFFKGTYINVVIQLICTSFCGNTKVVKQSTVLLVAFNIFINLYQEFIRNQYGNCLHVV
jgi:hypothetical protein